MPNWKRVAVSGSDVSFATLETSGKTTVKAGGAEVTGSLNVDGAIQEQGFSIPALVEKMVVDGSSTSILDFTTITDNSDELIIAS